MTALQILGIVAGALLLLFFVAAGGLLAWLSWSRSREFLRAVRDLRESAGGISGAVGELQKVIAAMSSTTSDLPALENGLIRVSQEQVSVLTELKEQVKTFNESVAKLYASLFSKDTSAYQEYDDKQASKAYEVQELMDKGMSREDAEARLNQNRIYTRKTMGL